ncbi:MULTISPECIES: P-loop NTPase fold protein [Trichocoleus]|uniref:P-loop NTPase fold protein n=1 Tax=Trichocoleus desertorum GB2-A4 TaxID=2933944 RepID=A0ABV0JFI8_9CYAN|nr:P-loop NTPase fold protein [Trichocoleus sp. FACHB-46]MBD1863035.1 NTPase [Trichocoleus sp. FACHB-46]
MRRFWPSFFRKAPQQQSNQKPAVENRGRSNDLYITDSPVSRPEQDRFNRWSFSERVAQTITSRSDPSSIVIGIYGPWGDGKTTVLNFIEQYLQGNSNIICVKFNPWRFTDETSLIKGFFQDLAKAIGKSISSDSEKIGEWLDKYSIALTSFNVTFAGAVQVNAGQGFQGLGKSLSSVDLQDLKQRVELHLKNERKRVVILMDDIDRLDKNEIQTVFKLVKLSADFDYTAYILAFDEAMVAAALSEKYGSGDIKAGRNFLEKIIQVPLNLPKADRVALLEYCIEGIQEVLSDLNIQISEEQFRYYFLKKFVDGLEIQLKTPRMVKRYINALAFSLPILKGEVNLLDLMLVEGMRIFYPALYEIVRNNSDIFAGSPFSYYNNQEFQQRTLNLIDVGTQGLNTDEAMSAKDLLKALFPHMNRSGVLGNVDYISSWKEEYDREQRVASIHYFSRFFSYSVSSNDVSDQEIAAFLSQIENNSIEEIVTNIRRIIGDRRANAFILKARDKSKQLSSLASQKLALAISMIGDVFSGDRDLIISSFSKVGMVVNELVKNIDVHEIRLDVAKKIISQASPIEFALECFYWLTPSKQSGEEDSAFSVEQRHVLAKFLIQEIIKLSCNAPIYIKFPEDARTIIYVWEHWVSIEEASQYLIKTLDQDPQNSVELLKCYVPTKWSSAFYGARKGDFERSQYDDLSKLVDPSFIYELIYSVYGAVLDNPKYDSNESQRSFDEKVVNQFAYIHQAVLKSKDR